MDDFNISSLHESKNEWGSRLLTILTPLITEGFKSIFDEAVNLCKSNNEMDKYLMTFQNFISRIPKWNQNIIETEKLRIIERSGCNYMEDLVTCVHIIQLKLLTAVRVGQKQKKIDISIPKLDDFIHKIYINVARKVYKNVYLFEINIPPLQVQKHHRELEIIIQECILNTVRESIPVETILRAYMDETVEEEVIEEIKEEVIEKPKVQPVDAEKDNSKPHIISEEPPVAQTEIANATAPNMINMPVESDVSDFPELSEETSSMGLGYSDSAAREDSIYNKYSEKYSEKIYDTDTDTDTDADDSGPVRLNIKDQPANLDNFDVHVLDEPEINLNDNLLLEDIEVLT